MNIFEKVGFVVVFLDYSCFYVVWNVVKFLFDVIGFVDLLFVEKFLVFIVLFSKKKIKIVN